MMRPQRRASPKKDALDGLNGNGNGHAGSSSSSSSAPLALESYFDAAAALPLHRAASAAQLTSSSTNGTAAAAAASPTSGFPQRRRRLRQSRYIRPGPLPLLCPQLASSAARLRFGCRLALRLAAAGCLIFLLRAAAPGRPQEQRGATAAETAAAAAAAAAFRANASRGYGYGYGSDVVSPALAAQERATQRRLDAQLDLIARRGFLGQLETPACGAEPLRPDDVTYTLVTQCSGDRLWMLEHHCRRWARDHADAHLSVVVYTNETLADVRHRLQYDYGCPLAEDRVRVQVLSKRYFDDADYPVNILRNLAFAAVATTHAVYVDIDFWPSTDLYDILTLDTTLAELAAHPRDALVVPAFALRRQCREWRDCTERNIPLMPRTKADLIPLLLNRTVTAFDPTNFGGHGSTRYVDWVDQTAEGLLDISCVKSNRYEPYLVVRACRDVLPPFQPRFTGYGKNKMSWLMHLRRAGWRLRQLGEAFVVHYPHLDSQARMAWNGGPKGLRLKRPAQDKAFADYKRGQNDRVFVEFRDWLQETVPDDTLVPKCRQHLDDDARLWVPHDSNNNPEGGEHGHPEKGSASEEEGAVTAAS